MEEVVIKKRINSKQKGKRGELEAAKWLRDNFGVHAIRGVQYAGSSDSPDVVGIVGVHLEIKNVENLNLYKAVAQAERDCFRSVPIVMHKKNNSKWHITFRADDWKAVTKIIHNLQWNIDAKQTKPEMA